MAGRQRQIVEWMGGFVDAEGNVGTNVQKTKKGIGYRVNPKVRIEHAYVAGFIDGEGSLRVNTLRNNETSVDYQLYPKVVVSQSVNDPLESAFESYCDKWGIAPGVYHIEREDENRSDMVNYEVAGTRDVRMFLEPIRDVCVVKQTQIAIMLDKILPLMGRKAHLNKRGFLKITAWKDLMDSFKGSTRGDYNLSHFEDLWDMELDTDSLDTEPYSR